MTKRSGALLVLSIGLALGIAIFVLFRTRQESLAPESVPLGQTVKQQLPGPDGKPVTWTITKKEVEREALREMVLPQPEAEQTPSNDSARASLGKALESWKHGDIAAALDEFEAALAVDPDDPEVRTQYGRLLMLMTDYERALPQLERAAQLEPNDAQTWLDLQTLYERSVLLERAGYARKKAESLAPGARIGQDENGFYFLEGNSLFP